MFIFAVNGEGISMQSDVSLAQVKQFPVLLWNLLFGAFITRGSFYMVWPFLSIILYQCFAISATEVGLILSLAAFVSVFIGFLGGTLADRIGRHKLMYASGILYVISLSFLAITESLTGYIVAGILSLRDFRLYQLPRPDFTSNESVT